MAATLLDVAIPSPALSLSQGTHTGTGAGANIMSGNTALSANVPAAINSASLSPGTYLVLGIFNTVNGTPSAYLSLTSGVASNSWPVQQVTQSAVVIISAVVKVTSTTTVYLNGESTTSETAAQGAIIATRIQ